MGGGAMNEIRMNGMDAADPLGFLAAIGVLRTLTRHDAGARLGWVRDGVWSARLQTSYPVDVLDLLVGELERWRAGHPALEFAVEADRKVQDLKHPPADFRALMLGLVGDAEAAEFVAAYATGVAIDGSGQTKPTSFHFTAGQQRFMDAVLDLRACVTREDLTEAIRGPWVGRVGPKDTRWRAASGRDRALLSYDPGKEKSATVAGAAWLAFLALPLFPVVPAGMRAITSGFTGRGKRERFTWPVWEGFLALDEIRTLLGHAELGELNAHARSRRGISQVLRADVVRNPQGYGNFSASQPV
jgi:hypothetical protein